MDKFIVDMSNRIQGLAKSLTSCAKAAKGKKV